MIDKLVMLEDQLDCHTMIDRSYHAPVEVSNPQFKCPLKNGGCAVLMVVGKDDSVVQDFHERIIILFVMIVFSIRFHDPITLSIKTRQYDYDGAR